MIRSKVLIQRIVSSDGKSVAEAKSVVITSDESESTINQCVTVEVCSGNRCSSRSTSSVTSK